MEKLWPDEKKSHTEPKVKVSLRCKTKPNSHTERVLVNYRINYREKSHKFVISPDKTSDPISGTCVLQQTGFHIYGGRLLFYLE